MRTFKLEALQQKQRYIPKKVKHEESLQKQVCSFLRMQYPHVIFRSDFASGLKLSQFQAVQHRSMQSSRSWPDLFIYQPMQHKDTFYCGLALELKKEGTTIVVTRGERKGHITSNPHIQEQALMLKELKKLGYSAHFAVGFDEAVNIINWYFLRPKQQNTSIF